MKHIDTVEARKLIGSEHSWKGKITISIKNGNVSGLSYAEFGRHIKKMLREKYPVSKKSIRVQHSTRSWNRWLFQVEFVDDSEEAEFIFTIKNLEGTLI